MLASATVLTRVAPDRSATLTVALRGSTPYFRHISFATQVNKKDLAFSEVFFVYPSDALLSQAAARQVSSAPQSLTTVFGMGTGVSSALLSLSFLNTIHLSYLL